MRLAPVLIPHLRTGGADLMAGAALLALAQRSFIEGITLGGVKA